MLKKDDIDIMDTGRARGVRFDRWIHDEIEAIAKKKGLTFTDVVNMLLGSELEYMGYSKAKYDAKTYGLGRDGMGGSEMEPSDKHHHVG
jgi:hypothetical protein